MPLRTVISMAAALLLFVPVLASCSTSGDETVTIYSGRTEELVGPLLDDFAAQSGIDIEVRYGDSSELALLIDQEGDRSPADVFLSQSPGAVGFLDADDRLAELSAETLDLVPAPVRATEGNWVGISGRKRVLVYNQDLVDAATLPDSVLDLTGPQFQGDVALAPTNGSFQDFVTAMRADLGDEATQEWLEGMAANDSPEYANNNAIVEAVSRGEVPMGLVNHYYNVRFLEEDPDLPSRNFEFAPDDPGSILIVTAAAVLDTADDPAQAEELVRFLLSREAQEFFAQETFEYPLAAGVEPPAGLEPIEFTDADTVDFEELGGGLEGTIDLIRESGLGA